MTQQQARWAKKWLKFSVAAIVFLVVMFFNQAVFHPHRVDLHRQLKNQQPPTAELNALSLRHFGGMRQPDTFYLRQAEIKTAF